MRTILVLGLVSLLAGVASAKDDAPDPKHVAEIKAHAEAGDAAAQRELGELSWRGAGVPKDFAVARAWYRKAAEQNDARAQFDLFLALDSANGGPADRVESQKWLRKSADQGLPEAEFYLWIAYSSGPQSSGDIPKDDGEALKWLRKAAEGGHAMSQASLGTIYHRGQLLAKDDAAAFGWWHKAAEQGLPGAWRDVGACYAKGEGVPKDPVQAYKWLLLAASLDDRDAMVILITASKEWTEAQRAEGEKAAREFVPSAPSPKAKTKERADAGDAKAQYELGSWHALGDEVLKDASEAVKWYRSSAEQNYAAAQVSLATYYTFGRGGLPIDLAQAYKWNALAAAQGNEEGKDSLKLLDDLGMTAADKAQGEKLVREFKAKLKR